MRLFEAVVAFWQKGQRRRTTAVVLVLLLSLCNSVGAESLVAPAEPPLTMKSTARCRSQLENVYKKALDAESYGLVGEIKYLDLPSVEWGLSFPESGSVGQWVNGSLRANKELFDMVWGGVYAHSKSGDWKQPCYTKLLARQSATIALYAGAYRLSGISEYRSLAERTVEYVERFLKDSAGSYYTSQGACGPEDSLGEQYYELDDAARQKRGVPALNHHVNVGENADFVRAVGELYAVSNDERFEEIATRGARALVAAEEAAARGDTNLGVDARVRDRSELIAVGRAFLALYSTTGNREWLSRAGQVLDRLIRKSSASNDRGTTDSNGVEISTSLARFSNMMYHYTRNTGYRDAAARALEVALPGRCEDISASDAARLLLAEREIGEKPPHVVLIGDPEESRTKDLWRVILSRTPSYALRERFSSASEVDAASEVRYPKLPRPAVFVCIHKRCSLPIFDTDELGERIAEMATGERGTSHAGS